MLGCRWTKREQYGDTQVPEKKMFELVLVDEKEAIEFYTKASVQASADGDIETRTLVVRIALDEEQHMGWLELQLDLLARMGEPA